MKAAFITRYGATQPLIVADLPDPHPADDAVLIRIHAASVNPVDFKVRDGKLRLVRRYRFPLILGHDLAGVVVEVGSRVTAFHVGDEVYARAMGHGIGTFAEYIAVEQSEVALKPRNLSFIEAASLPLVALTSWQALVDIGSVQPGTRVLIHAGSGGIGTFAIQLAKSLGAVVTTTTSSRNSEFVRTLGADHVIDYTQQDFVSAAGPQDLVFATIEGASVYRSFEVLAPGGIVVSIVGPPDATTARELDLGWLRTTLFSLISTRANALARKHSARYRFLFMKAHGAQLRQVASLVEAGRIRPVIEHVYPLAQAQRALEHCEQGRTRGKVVIEC